MLFDFLIILIFLIVAFSGYKKGFAQMLISLGAFVLSIFLVAGIYNYLGDAFFASDYGTSLVESVSHGIEERITDAANFTDNVPFLNGVIKGAAENSGIVHTLAQKAIKTLMTIPLLIISFILLRLLLFSLRKIVSKTTTIPIISTVDSMLGLALGAVSGVIIVAVSYFILGYIQLLPSMDFITKQFDSSLIIALINDIL